MGLVGSLKLSLRQLGGCGYGIAEHFGDSEPTLAEEVVFGIAVGFQEMAHEGGLVLGLADQVDEFEEGVGLGDLACGGFVF